MPEAITLLERRLLIWFWTELGNSLINVLVSKDFSCSTLSAEEPDLDLLLCSWSACLLTTARNPSLNLPSTQLLRLLLLLLSLTMQSLPHTPLLNIPTVPLWLTMRLSMTSAAGISELRDHPTPTLTD